MNKIFRKEVVIGISVICALAILIFGIDYLKGINVFHASNYYMISYTDVKGLEVSAPVTVNGYKVGQVREIQYQYDNPGHILVEVSLDRDLHIPDGSKAVISADMLGTASIVLQLADNKNFLDPGAYIDPVEAPSLMENVQNELLPSVAGVVPKVDTLLTTTNNLLADPALAASIKRLDAITANLEATSIALNSTVGALPPVTKDVKAITGSLVTTTSNLEEFSGDVKQLPLDSLVNQLQLTATNLRMLTEQLNNPNSSLGLMMRDPALYQNLNHTVQSLDSLFIDIKKQPKRYINIKLL